MSKQIITISVLICLASSAWAQPGTPAAGPPAVGPLQATQPVRYLSDVPPGLFSAERLKGVEVIGLDTNRVGEIEDVMVDRTGRVAAVVIDVGGFLGIGGKHVAVPFEALLLNFEASPTDGPASSTSGVGVEAQRARNNDPTTPGANTVGSVGTPGSAPNVATTGSTGQAVVGGPGPLTPMAQGSAAPAETRTGMETAMGGAPAIGVATVPIVSGELTRVVLRATRADLERAPEFRKPR